MTNKIKKLVGLSLILTIVAGFGYSQSSNPRRGPTYQYKSQKEYFDSLSPERLNGSFMAVASERRFIQKGDSVRIKYAFDRRFVTNITLEGGPTAPFEAIKEGVWIVTVKPENTKAIRAKFTIRDPNFGDERHTYGNQIIIVFEPKEYKEVAKKVAKFEKDGDSSGAAKYLNSFVSQDVFKQFMQRR